MRKIVGSALAALVTMTVVAACRSPATPAPAGSPGAVAGTASGASTATMAVEGFLQAARTTDVRGMAQLFGTAEGSIAGRQPDADVEKRMRALACYLTHDGARLIDDVPGVGRGRLVTMELRQRELSARPRFTVVSAGNGRWFVESFDINALSDFCRPSDGTRPPG